MEDMDMRHALLAELIDQMHGRLADKMFPPDPSETDKPAVEGITKDSKTAEGYDIPRASEHPATEGEHGEVPAAGDDKSDSTGIPGQEMTDEELDEMMKGLTND